MSLFPFLVVVGVSCLFYVRLISHRLDFVSTQSSAFFSPFSFHCPHSFSFDNNKCIICFFAFIFSILWMKIKFEVGVTQMKRGRKRKVENTRLQCHKPCITDESLSYATHIQIRSHTHIPSATSCHGRRYFTYFMEKFVFYFDMSLCVCALE